jgi:hypothetical protein
VAQSVVEHAAPAAAPAPDERAVRAAPTRVKPYEDVHVRTRIVLKHIELFVDREALRERSSRGSAAVFDDESFGARYGVVAELCTDHPDVPGPVVKGVRRGVKAAAIDASLRIASARGAEHCCGRRLWECIPVASPQGDRNGPRHGGRSVMRITCAASVSASWSSIARICTISCSYSIPVLLSARTVKMVL